MKACLPTKPMYCSREYFKTSRLIQQYEKPTSKKFKTNEYVNSVVKYILPFIKTYFRQKYIKYVKCTQYQFLLWKCGNGFIKIKQMNKIKLKTKANKNWNEWALLSSSYYFCWILVVPWIYYNMWVHSEPTVNVKN